jgi:hypothetical protein
MKRKKFRMMLRKWLTLSNKDKFTPEYLKNCVKPEKTAHKSPATYRSLVA